MNEDRTPHAWGKGRLLLLGLAILLIVVGPVILLQRLARDTAGSGRRGHPHA